MITPKDFYNYWITSCDQLQTDLFHNWSKKVDYSNLVFKGSTSILDSICEKLDLNYVTEYYSLDVVFYDDPDNIMPRDSKSVWLKKIQIAFEHEHDISSTFKEISHLTLTNAELRVLVTYPENEEEKNILDGYKDIILYNKGNQNLDFLIIFGTREDKKIKWEGHILQNGNWTRITP